MTSQHSPFLAQADALAGLLAQRLQQGAEPAGLAAEFLARVPSDPALLVAARILDLEAAKTLPDALPLLRFAAALRRAVFGPMHPSVAAMLQRIAEALATMDELQAAASVLQEAVEICQTAQDGPGLAACLSDWGTILATLAADTAESVLAQALNQLQAVAAHPVDHATVLAAQRDLAFQRGDDALAWDRAQAAVAAVTAGYGSAAPQTVVALLEAARIGGQTQDRDIAAALVDQAAGLLDAPGAAEHPAFWTAMLAWGVFQMELGRQETSRQFISAANPLVAQYLGETHPARLQTLEAMGDWSLRFTASEVARVFHDMCLSARRAEAGPPRLRIAKLLVKCGDGWMRQGETAQARLALSEALALRRTVLGEEHPLLVETHLALGSLALQSGQYATAAAHFEEGLSLQQDCGAPRAVLAALNAAKARLLSDLGDHKAALRLELATVVQRLALHGVDHPASVDERSVFAAVVLRWGGPASATKLIEQVLQARWRACRANEGAPQAALAATLCDAGALAAARGEHARSAWCFAAAADRLDRLHGRGHPDLAASRLGQAAAALARGAPAAARDLAASGLARGTASLPPEDAWRLLAMLADAFAALHLAEAAIFFGKCAVGRLQRIRTALQPLGRAMQAHFLGDRSTAYWHAAERLIAAGRLGEAQRVVGLLKAAELREGLRGDATLGPDTALTPGEATWRAAMDAMLAAVHAAHQAATAIGDGIPALPEHQAALAVAGQHRRDAELAWLDWVRTALAAPVTPPATDPTPLTRLSEQLGPATAALDYLVRPDHVEIIVTTATDQQVIHVPLAEAPMNAIIFQLWSRLRRRAPDVLDPAQRLYRALFAPVEPVLAAAGVTQLLLSLTGALRYVPFAALHDGAHSLGAVYATTFRATGSAPPPDTRRNTGPAVLFGAGHADGKLARLAHVSTEIATVAECLPHAVMHMDQAFTAASLRAALDTQPAIVHLATHFTLLPGREPDSWLLLGDGTPLTAAALLDGRFALRGIELLTLSACETAMAAGTASGREVETLPAALLAAGVGTVLASLWPVDDASTALLMRHFYQGWQVDGLAAADALHRAQNRLAQDGAGDGQHAHPHDWAAFVLFVPGA